MQQRDNPRDEEWEDLVRRLKGTASQAHTEPMKDSVPTIDPAEPAAGSSGPRDYSVLDEQVEDFRPPEPKPIASGNPRTVLSWSAVIGSAILWLAAALLGWSLPWWFSALTIVAFLAGGLSLFFLLPKTWAHRDPLGDDEDYGHGAKL